jgi:hypothetical protein
MRQKIGGPSGGGTCLSCVTPIEALLNAQLVMGLLFYSGQTFGTISFCKINFPGCSLLQKIS